MGDEWREWKEDAKEHRQKKRAINTALAHSLAEKYRLIISEFNDGTQIRFLSGKIKLDYFPTSGKVKIGDRFFVANLENEIKKHFGLCYSL